MTFPETSTLNGGSMNLGVRSHQARAQRRGSPEGEVLERAVQRIARYLRRHGSLGTTGSEDDDVEPEERLAASAVSGQAPPAGPQWLRGLPPLSPSALVYDKPLCA